MALEQAGVAAASAIIDSAAISSTTTAIGGLNQATTGVSNSINSLVKSLGGLTGELVSLPARLAFSVEQAKAFQEVLHGISISSTTSTGSLRGLRDTIMAVSTASGLGVKEVSSLVKQIEASGTVSTNTSNNLGRVAVDMRKAFGYVTQEDMSKAIQLMESFPSVFDRIEKGMNKTDFNKYFYTIYKTQGPEAARFFRSFYESMDSPVIQEQNKNMMSYIRTVKDYESSMERAVLTVGQAEAKAHPLIAGSAVGVGQLIGGLAIFDYFKKFSALEASANTKLGKVTEEYNKFFAETRRLTPSTGPNAKTTAEILESNYFKNQPIVISKMNAEAVARDKSALAMTAWTTNLASMRGTLDMVFMKILAPAIATIGVSSIGASIGGLMAPKSKIAPSVGWAVGGLAMAGVGAATGNIPLALMGLGSAAGGAANLWNIPTANREERFQGLEKGLRETTMPAYYGGKVNGKEVQDYIDKQLKEIYRAGNAPNANAFGRWIQTNVMGYKSPEETGKKSKEVMGEMAPVDLEGMIKVYQDLNKEILMSTNLYTDLSKVYLQNASSMEQLGYSLKDVNILQEAAAVNASKAVAETNKLIASTEEQIKVLSDPRRTLTKDDQEKLKAAKEYLPVLTQQVQQQKLSVEMLERAAKISKFESAGRVATAQGQLATTTGERLEEQGFFPYLQNPELRRMQLDAKRAKREAVASTLALMTDQASAPALALKTEIFGIQMDERKLKLQSEIYDKYEGMNKLLSTQQGIYSGLFNVASQMYLPWETQMKYAKTTVAIGKQELENAREMNKAVQANPNASRGERLEAQKAEVEALSKYTSSFMYARRNLMEQMTAGFLGIGSGASGGMLPKVAPEGIWKGPTWHEGAIVGSTQGRLPEGVTWQGAMNKTYGPIENFRNMFERTSDSISKGESVSKVQLVGGGVITLKIGEKEFTGYLESETQKSLRKN